MNLSLYIAKRYLFSKKTHNAINIISMIAVCGIAIATMGAVCTMSVFNGFEKLVSGIFGAFDPELKITPSRGKVFDPQADENILNIRFLPEIEAVSETLEDNALVRYKERQVPVIMKGVSGDFEKVAKLTDILFDGEFKLKDEENNFSVLGIGVASNLGVNSSLVYPIDVFVPDRSKQVNLSNPLASLKSDYSYVGGIFMVGQPQYDDNYILVSLDYAREMFDYKTEVSSLEIKLKKETDIRSVKRKLKESIGDNYLVKDRYEQQEAAFKMMSIEKWVSFLMLCFIILIAAFNIIGSLSILIVDKQKDIQTLRNLGANNSLISRVFLFEGWMISVVGGIIGIVLGVLICLGQSYFGWIKLGNVQGAFAVDAYPVIIQFGDVILVFLSVLLIGFLTVFYPVKYFSKKMS
ncbi:MAG: ABC transporter permease [Dysgonamonadaceae bacterium]|nr:ABC transporter permease [Dysgonamonadaceae bacterium]